MDSLELYSRIIYETRYEFKTGRHTTRMPADVPSFAAAGEDYRHYQQGNHERPYTNSSLLAVF